MSATNLVMSLREQSDFDMTSFDYIIAISSGGGYDCVAGRGGGVALPSRLRSIWPLPVTTDPAGIGDTIDNEAASLRVECLSTSSTRTNAIL
jgi:hypothetical protein